MPEAEKRLEKFLLSGRFSFASSLIVSMLTSCRLKQNRHGLLLRRIFSLLFKLFSKYLETGTASLPAGPFNLLCFIIFIHF